MNQNYQIVTPIPKTYSLTKLCTEFKLSSEEKPTDGQDKNQNTTSLNLLTGNNYTRRNSAFSIYQHNLQQESHKNTPEHQNSSFSPQQMELYSKRTWRRQKKDKRQMNRLQTKNLNRYFRSKINQMLRDIKQNPSNQQQYKKADEVLLLLNKSNKIMFSQIREIIKGKWLQKKLLSCSGALLKYIHGGKMGMQSKLIMLKYFNKILKAIRNPDNFTCWK